MSKLIDSQLARQVHLFDRQHRLRRAVGRFRRKTEIVDRDAAIGIEPRAADVHVEVVIVNRRAAASTCRRISSSSRKYK